MWEFPFYSYTDFAFRSNYTQGSITLPFHPYRPITERLVSDGAAVPEPSHDLNVPYTVFEILVAVFAVVGNLMVIIVFQRERKLRRRTNYYIVSLAIADFLVGSLGVPFAILASIGLPTNLYACLFTVSLLIVLCTTSIFCLVAVSVDRYWAILYPMAYSRNVRTRTAIVIISLCWLAGFVVGFLPLFGWHADVDTHQACLFTVVMDYNYLVFLYFATIITPALLMLAFYVHIYRVIVRQVRQIVTMNPVGDCSRRSSTAQIQTSSMTGRPCHGGTMLRVLGASRKREVKATQNLSIIVLFFMICWFPLYTINCIQAFCKTCKIPEKLTLFCIILSHLNSAVNPVLYAYHLRDFRAALKNLILRIMGVEAVPSLDAAHRFSLASQHRLQSIDSNARNTLQPRIYIDSPIWLRQQQQQAMKNSPLNKYGVISPCLNNLNQTVAAVAAVTPDLENKIWNIREVSSGQEVGAEINYVFPDSLEVDVRPSSPREHRLRALRRQESGAVRSESPYSYENRNYSTSQGDDDGNSGDCAADETEGEGAPVHLVANDIDDVFMANGSAAGAVASTSAATDTAAASVVAPHDRQEELNNAVDRLACSMREKLRSDDCEYLSLLRSSQSNVISDSSFSDYGTALESVPQPPPRKKTTGTAASSTSSSTPVSPVRLGPRLAAGSTGSVYVIDRDCRTMPHRTRLKMAALDGRSRSCSCNMPETPATPKAVGLSATSNSIGSLNGSLLPLRAGSTENGTSQANNNNSHTASNLNFYAEMQQQQQNRHHSPPQRAEKFSPLKAVSNFIFPPIVKHSSLFQLFHSHGGGGSNEDADGTKPSALTTTPTATSLSSAAATATASSCASAPPTRTTTTPTGSSLMAYGNLTRATDAAAKVAPLMAAADS